MFNGFLYGDGQDRKYIATTKRSNFRSSPVSLKISKQQTMKKNKGNLFNVESPEPGGSVLYVRGPDQIEFERAGFYGGRITGELGEKHSEQGENQQQTLDKCLLDSREHFT